MVQASTSVMTGTTYSSMTLLKITCSRSSDMASTLINLMLRMLEISEVPYNQSGFCNDIIKVVPDYNNVITVD
jgi:hypothetical protein